MFRREDGKYLIYLPKDLAEDSMFPFKTERSMKVKISFKVGEKKLMIEPLAGLKGRAEKNENKKGE